MGAITLINILNGSGVIFYLVALSYGYVTLVESVVSLQYIFVFLLTIFLSLFFPKIFKEKISKIVVILKVAAIILIIGGIILII